jgi:hypothetical protein
MIRCASPWLRSAGTTNSATTTATATAAALGGDPFGELGAWLQLLVAFDLVMIVAGAATYGYLLED